MALSKAIAAKVGAYYTSWADPEEFAECAEKGIISIQRHYLLPYIRFGFFAIGKGEKEFPLDRLTDLSYAHHMHVVLPYDTVSAEIIEILALIESRRELGREEADKTGWATFEGRGIYEVEVVADVGEDPSTGETRYGCMSFPFSPSLITKIQKDLRRNGKQVEANASSTSPEAIKAVFGVFEKGTSWTTLHEVDEFARMIKKYKVPQEIKGERLLTGKGVGVTAAIGTVRNVGDSDVKLMAQIEPDDIVVAVGPHPYELQTFCQKVAGFITDKGGVTCNTAIFARENGIPAIVGTHEATRILKNRQKVIVNGSKGAVYV